MENDKRSYRELLQNLCVVAKLIHLNGRPRWEAWIVAWLIEVRGYSLYIGRNELRLVHRSGGQIK